MKNIIKNRLKIIILILCNFNNLIIYSVYKKKENLIFHFYGYDSTKKEFQDLKKEFKERKIKEEEEKISADF
jgi:hypothetical protein